MPTPASSSTSCVLRLPPRVLVVAGATASGKSAMAVALAQALGAEIVGADSRQVYQRMDIGTAKPSQEERELVRHHVVDVVDPAEPYDVSQWRRDALDALSDIHARGKLAIVCGGTGLYIRSLTRGLFSGPPADPLVRERLEAREAVTPGCLHRELQREDAASAARIHPNDLLRTVRALEVKESTGRPLSAWLAEHGLSERLFETLTLDVSVDRDLLRERIAERSRRMVEDGLIEELAGLYALGYAPTTRAFDAIGYRQAAMCLEGTLPRNEVADAVSLATSQYAKRQRTWLRGQAEARPVAPDARPEALRLARAFFS